MEGGPKNSLACGGFPQSRGQSRVSLELTHERNPSPLQAVGWSSLAASKVHNLEIAGSNPASATKAAGMSSLSLKYAIQELVDEWTFLVVSSF